MNSQEFYEECSRILGTRHEGTAFPYRKRTRWNNRTAGRGRYPDRGVIRLYGETVHVMLRNPATNMTFPTMESALEFLKNIA